MKLTAVLLAIGIAPLAMAAAMPPPRHHSYHDDSSLNLMDHPPKTHIEPRGLSDDIRTKKKCDSMFKSDKTPYVIACAGEPDQDSKNLCELRALVGDASVECRAALLKNMGF